VYWLAAGGYGALGGAAVSAVAFAKDLMAWRETRRLNLELPQARRLRLSQFTDYKPDFIVAAARMVLGTITGSIFHGEISGVIPTITMGASAPLILSQLGKSPFYSPEAEAATGSEDTGLSPAEPAAEHVAPSIGQQAPKYVARHAKDPLSPGSLASRMPLQRVKPDTGQLTQGETNQ
jgi:hypothetical protein